MGFQKQAKSSEAKANLGALYTSEKAYFYEQSEYSKKLTDIGFSAPEGNREYAIGFLGALTTNYFGTGDADPGLAYGTISATAATTFHANCIPHDGTIGTPGTTNFIACATGTTSTKEDFKINDSKKLEACGTTRGCS